MLRESYHDWELFSEWEFGWKEYDKQVFQLPDSVGASGKVTVFDNHTVGFVSWDPRNYPDYVIIGHNCVLPEYRRQGLGKMQIIHSIKFLNSCGFKKARVSTGKDMYFQGARKMYESCGFIECEAYRNDGPNMIYYERVL